MIRALYLTGRCVDGAQRDSGTLRHAVKDGEYRALCGAQPGRRSAGWGPFGDYVDMPVTCPRCLKKIPTD